MFMALNAPAIGIKGLDLPQLLKLAQATGFAGVDFDIAQAHAYAQAQSREALRTLFTSHNQRPATWGLPVIGPQTEWGIDAAALRAQAKTAASIGATRCVTWVPSWHDSRGFSENRAFHLKRFREIAEILAGEGCRFGLEFLGPKELQKRGLQTFIHTMSEMLELAHDVGTGNVGLLLDAYHLYTSGGSFTDVKNVAASTIVQVHINDALKGVAIDALPDGSRCPPLETGVLDLETFMRNLASIGYEGPVVTEPFNARLNALAMQNPEAAAQEVATAMKRLWAMANLK